MLPVVSVVNHIYLFYSLFFWDKRYFKNTCDYCYDFFKYLIVWRFPEIDFVLLYGNQPSKYTAIIYSGKCRLNTVLILDFAILQQNNKYWRSLCAMINQDFIYHIRADLSWVTNISSQHCEFWDRTDIYVKENSYLIKSFKLA